MLGHVTLCLKKWAAEELKLTMVQGDLDCVEKITGGVLERRRSKTQTISILLERLVLIAIYEKWFGTCITERMGYVFDCFIEEVTDTFSCMGLLRKTT